MILLPRDIWPSSEGPPRRPPRPPVPMHVRLQRVVIGLSALAVVPPLIMAFGPAIAAAIYAACVAAWLVWLNLR